MNYKLYELATYRVLFFPNLWQTIRLSFVNLEIFKNPDRGGVSKKFSKIQTEAEFSILMSEHFVSFPPSGGTRN